MQPVPFSGVDRRIFTGTPPHHKAVGHARAAQSVGAEDPASDFSCHEEPRHRQPLHRQNARVLIRADAVKRRVYVD